MTSTEWAMLKDNFRVKNIEIEYYQNLDDVKQSILECIPKESTVGIANSQTLKKMMISEALAERGNVTCDKTFAKSKEEAVLLKKKSFSVKYLPGR